jgi:eukaryotic-like serine/threonine-protein kinase
MMDQIGSITMSHSDSEADPLVDLAQDFADRYRRGERPSLSDYTGRFPEHADRIRRIFPAMVAMERHGTPAEWSAGAQAAPDGSGSPVRERLGEYRIVREIARGGMGVVYEAVQESLARHVALKVLPLHSMSPVSQLERFRLEARAAARLHHSNIVPVFGVGESDGVHYYAMQYIEGHNLDVVLQEVRRLRGQPFEARGVGTRRSGLSVSLARSMVSGRLFHAAKGADDGGLVTDQGGAKADAPDESCPTIVATRSSGSGSELANQSDLQYLRSVARIGLQVTEALAYAHDQGVLHRDIKPANILLDTQGTAWVTDFGLAKADDSAELTGQGDIVGTLRYMAPERFGGRADRRSDVYGLGLTLYELLTLRSAFASSDRARLVDQVLHVEPPHPRKADPRIPRDLETIVLKAMAKEPARRYATAAALAEDLRRFMGDRPILARRTPAWERGWRFCRRNPALAFAGALVVSLLVAFAVGSAAAMARLDLELKRTGEAKRAEQAAKKDALDKLWRSYLARAQAGRFGRRPGQRLDGLEALRQAVPIARSVDAPKSSFDELRDEAIACLALPDLRPARGEVDCPPGTSGIAFDGFFKQYAAADSQGNLSVRRAGEVEPVARFTDLGSVPKRYWISPDGRLLGIALPDSFQMRDIDGGRVAFSRAGKVVHAEFTADSRRAAIGRADGSVVLFDLPTAREVARVLFRFEPTLFALRPDGLRLAIADQTRDAEVEIWDLDPPRKVAPIRLGDGGSALGMAWSPDGRRLALGLKYSDLVEIWDVAELRPLVALTGHAQQVPGLSFHPDGNLLLSHSYDGSARLWHAGTGRQVVSWPSPIGDLHFSRDGKACGVVTIDGKPRVVEVESGSEYRTLTVSVGANRGSYFRADIGPDGLLALGMDDGVRLWDLNSGHELTFLPIGKTTSVHFVSGKRGRELLSCGPTGLERRPIHEDIATPGCLRIGPPRAVPLSMVPAHAHVGLDGRTAVVASEQSGAAIVLDLETEAVRCTLAPHKAVNRGELSADGRWAATAGWHTPTVKVWDAHTGALVQDLPVGGMNMAFFTPDSHSLITSVGAAYEFWDVSSWRPVRELRVDIPVYPGWVAFSPDRKLMALEVSAAVIDLVNAATGRTLARLADPHSDRAGWLGFTADGGRLVTISTFSQAIHVWDLRSIARQLANIGLEEEAPFTALIAGADVERPRAVEILADAPTSAGPALEQKARATIDLYRRAVTAHPARAIEYNNLAWAYLTAPEPLRDSAEALAMAQRSAALEPRSAAYRNTLGVAYYRAGRYRDAADVLRANLEVQEDRFLAWDLLFLAMSYHRLGETDRAREYRNLARRWSRDQKGVPVEQLHELSAMREEMEATLAK